MDRQSWTTERIARLREAYRAGGRRGVRSAFPELSDSVVSNAIARFKKLSGAWVAPSSENRDVADEQLLSSGDVDRGEREFIRKRIAYTIEALSVELRRASREVARAVKDIAKDNFKPEAHHWLKTGPENRQPPD